MESDSDDEETFVTLGTPQEVPDKDEPRKKPVSFQDIQAKDNKGRPRFHGAFTGGFSAGYFNTVGTQEGFTPSTFVSSRNDRQKSQTGQRPEDFMDEEDLGEHGIAPRKYVTSGSFASEERRKRRHDEAMLATSDSALLGSTALLNLIVPERITIGVKLLRKMGWKEGQGVGPRLKKQERKKQGYSPCPSVTGGCGFRNAESVVYNAGLWCKTEAGHHQATKVYGCALPPADSDSDIDLDDESLLKDITYAPKDSAHILLNVKDNTKGLGYRGLDPTKALPSTHINLFSNPVMSKKGRKGIRGQAFGVGALEEEDDDIYAVDDMSNYDMTMTAENERDTFGWTGSRNQKQATTPVGYVGKLLEGFKLSSKKLVQKKDFPPPKLPSNFRPIHVFHKSTGQSNISEDRGVDYRKFLKPQDSDHAQASTSNGAQSQGVQRKQTNDSVSRSMALGEQPFVGSVFDLIPEKDKQRMDKARSGVPMDADDSQSDGQQGAVVHASRTEEKSSKSTLSETQNSGQSGSTPAGSGAPLFQGGSLGFKPFSSDSAKQQRYDKYLSLIKQGHKDPYTMVAEAGQTEWEMEKEKEEFSHAARLFKPLATMMAMRFTSAGVEDKLADVKKEEKVELSEPAKAASMKMYGKLTREVMEWHPDKLVCKRFNVPDPFPGSNLVGLASLKRDKYSVFNFLTFSNPTEADRNQQTKTENIEEKEEEKKETTTQNVDRTLKPRQGAAKAAGLKSIFTHLVNPAKQGNRATDPASKGVSFNIKSKVPQKSTEVADVFEDGSKKWDDGAKQMQKPGEDKENNDTKSTEKVGMDLFRAIFRNTDSESSSDDDDDDDHPESKANENKDTRLENSSNSKTNTQGPTNVVENIKMEVESVSNDIIESSNAKRESRENSSNSKQNTQGPTKVVENIKMEVELVSNEVIESSNAMQDQPTQAVLPGSGERIPSIKERLSPDEDSDSYGPALPPGNFAQTANNGNLEAAKSKDSKDTRDMDYIDLTKSSTKKHKHKHKEKHKSKKDKKAKYKKSKHKKKQKKKERKKKDRQMSDTDSSDTTDKDTDEETNVPSDRDLLNKLGFYLAEAGQTEWEMEKEKEEFAHAARLFKPLATMMAMRFTSAGLEDKLADVKKEEKVELSEPAKAASMKMYGKLTREIMEWHPDKLVCKRFNVPDPFPGSNLVGLASLKRDKYSVFNFLTFSNPTEADRNQQTRAENIEEKEGEKKETTIQNVDRTLKPRQGAAKAAGLKSIFTHLVNPAKQGNKATDPASKGVSFNIKSKVPQKSTEVADVFEDGSKKGDDSAKQMQKHGEDKENNDTKSTEKVGMDLFRAIFRNTDSESSSDDNEDSENDDQPGNKPNENKDTRLENSSNSKTNIEGLTYVVENIKMEVEPVSNKVIESSNAMRDQPTQALLPGSGERIPSIKERLSPDEDSDSYGPALPPGNFAQTANNGNLEAAGNKESKDTRDMDYIDLTKSSSKKHKHKHKEKHKSKKDKKAKYKKSKHKKRQKKKERKKKDRQTSDTDSSDTTDKDTDEETNVPSDRDLLNKLKQLKPGQRMRASDFM